MKKERCIFPDCDCHNSPLLCELEKQDKRDAIFATRILWFLFGVIMGGLITTAIYLFTIPTNPVF